MTRLTRRALLLVAFCLLTSVATAFTECAWVLWDHGAVTGAKGTTDHGWHPRGAFPAYRDCMKAAETHAMSEADLYKRDPDRLGALAQQGTTGVWAVTTFPKTGEIISIMLPCLPDTMDPRGSKGK